MGHLRLSLKQPAYTLGIGDTIIEGWRLRYDVAMSSWLDDVKLATGESLADLPGKLFLKAGLAEQREDKAIGALYYLASSPGSSDGVSEAMPTAFSIEVVVPLDRVMALIQMEQSGHGPTDVSVDVPGLISRYAPDGSDMEWDNSERNWRAVNALTFSFNREVEDAPEADDEIAAEAMPSAEARAITALSRKFDRAFPWVVGLLAVIAAGVILG